MIADVRRAVAVASYVMVTNRVASSVFDFANGGYHPMSVSHTGNFCQYMIIRGVIIFLVISLTSLITLLPLM